MASLEDQLREELEKDDQADYSALVKRFGSDALPDLERLVRENDPGMASQAAYVAGLIAAPGSHDVVSLAAASSHEVVRVAAAYTLPLLPANEAAPIAERLLADDDPGVRARAVRFAAASKAATLARQVHAIASEDPDEAVRELAVQVIEQSGLSQS